jgi:hypothetical protein
MQLEWDEQSADRPIDQWDNWCVVVGESDEEPANRRATLPLVAIRRRMDSNRWEVAIYGQTPVWQSMPNVNSREEAKVTAMAMYRMK